MNATNRVVNRILLFVVGLGLLVVAAAALLVVLPLPAAQEGRRVRDDLLRQAQTTVDGWGDILPRLGGLSGPAVLALAVGAVIALLLVFFLLTRGGGRTGELVRDETSGGTTTVDSSVAAAVLTASLRERADVLSSTAQAFRVRGVPAVRLVVVPRSGAALSEIIVVAEEAIEDWRALAGTRTPVLLHLADRSGVERLRSASRVR
ncbi:MULTISPECIES: hypothetical protein [Bacteria]|uniref:hypothetical protein n=1 Tax=Bacteria TaxID=2 RepID=UPI003C7E1941